MRLFKSFCLFEGLCVYLKAYEFIKKFCLSESLCCIYLKVSAYLKVYVFI